MDLSKKILTLLAIFCLIASAGVACAADTGDFDGGWAGSQYQDDGGWAGSQYNATEEPHGYSGSQYNATAEPHGYSGSQYNATLENGNATGNATHTAAQPTNNMTANATSSHTLPATGNPILILLGVSATLGGCAVALRRKN